MVDQTGLLAQRMAAENVEGLIDLCGGNKGDEAPFIGDMERIVAEQFAGALYLLHHRDMAFFDVDLQVSSWRG